MKAFQLDEPAFEQSLIRHFEEDAQETLPVAWQEGSFPHLFDFKVQIEPEGIEPSPQGNSDRIN